MRIGIVKERREHERRVAASPETVKRFKAMGLEPVIERGAGTAAAIFDEAYEQAGARLVDGPDEPLAADILLKVQRPTEDELARSRPGQLLVGMLDPYTNRDQVRTYADKGLTAFAMELLPRITRAQPMDVLSSQANLAGYRAVVEVMAAYSRVLPMMMTAAGTVTPAKVFVVGAGVAGLQAIATAKRMGAVVTATDVRPAAKEEIESLGAKFVGFIPKDAATAGGYARPLTPEEQAEQQKIVAEHIKSQDIVVTTALLPGRPAPRIVTAAMVASMRPGSVLFDMAAESGGNIEGSRPGEVVEVGGVKIIGARNLPSRLAPVASALYARNLLNFVQLLISKDGKLVIPFEDELIKGTLLTHEGKIVHPNFQSAS
ncbi:MAG: Re/Si-specific NAD(P)(+) transhydrogenase subunit alpha [Geminicoccaceae bacterium]|nr:Re/Si-specific NAD(P)(+) transhydrogenase subunit alpha [Geminicoccaceae bacterium]MCS7268724.1 Re/Si-specific NAD(P)(+) transhydrogenase subunit alpha [Geminicoccaceae bacterium]MDW8125800.1 Re/Si-specific NAD(P)(+) transhydrogenase subunit alpha [Geminicoccaceae bacterium]MDW8342610.1 Re/Si-specific NAD(P)(+) transhydrogenase subunit alpha [Geminicoccaceae bacterium]